MRSRIIRRIDPSMAVALAALFVALGGVAYSATGGNFILGQANTATTPSSLSAPVGAATLQVKNNSSSAGATALDLRVASGHAPMTVNSTAKVANLNADSLDDLSSTSFLRRGVTQSNNVGAAGGVVDVWNVGSTNGVRGRTSSRFASGVYGENLSGDGSGVEGVAHEDDGIGVFGTNTEGGWAGLFNGRVGMTTLDCSGCVGASDINGRVADSEKLDGIDSTGFVKGTGKVVSQVLAIPRGDGASSDPWMGLKLAYLCPEDVDDNSLLYVDNLSGGSVNVFVDDGGANPNYYYALADSTGTAGNTADRNGDSFRVQAHGAQGVLTLDVATVHLNTTCHVQAVGILVTS